LYISNRVYSLDIMTLAALAGKEDRAHLSDGDRHI
jgi:hypothetical protein